MRYSLDSSKLSQQLGWFPKHSFEQGIEETIRWYRENEDWWAGLANENILSATPWKNAW
jgi:dTDP-glucose 4,6-dehydratase